MLQGSHERGTEEPHRGKRWLFQTYRLNSSMWPYGSSFIPPWHRYPFSLTNKPSLYPTFFNGNKQKKITIRNLIVLGWKKPPNAQGWCKQFTVFIKSPTCFGNQIPSSGGYLFLLSYSSFSLRFGWMGLLFAWCGHLLRNCTWFCQTPCWKTEHVWYFKIILY
jgi:hypothetical protein